MNKDVDDSYRAIQNFKVLQERQQEGKQDKVLQ